MRAILAIMHKEISDGLRNRWVASATLLLAALALGLVFLGSAPTGTVGASPLAVTVVSLVSLTIFLIPLITLLLSFDAIVGDRERGTLLLILVYPVSMGDGWLSWRRSRVIIYWVMPRPPITRVMQTKFCRVDKRSASTN